MTTQASTRQSISIYWDEQDRQSIGWAYRIAGGSSGAIDGQAADAIQRIADGMPAEPGDYDAIRDAIEHRPGDLVSIDGPALPGGLGDLLDRADQATA